MKITKLLFAVIIAPLCGMVVACGNSKNAEIPTTIDSPTDTLIGKWEHTDISCEGEYIINSRLIFTFNSDGSGIAEFEANGKYIRPTSKQLNLKYSVSNDTLVIKYTESGQTMKNIIEQLDDTTMSLVGIGDNGQKMDFKKLR